jgi:ribosomal protein S25
MDFANEPLVSPIRLAERHKVGLNVVTRVMKELESRGEVHPHRTPSNRVYLSFADAQRLDEALFTLARVAIHPN